MDDSYEDMGGYTKPELTQQSSRKEFFYSFMTPSLIQQIVYCSNTYAELRRQNTERTPHSRKWGDPISVNEIHTFLALVMLQGIVKKRRLVDYWETDELTETPAFGRVMSRNRFQYILSSLHFFDTSAAANRDPNITKDLMRRIRLVFDTLRLKFKDAFLPTRIWIKSSSHRAAQT